MAELLTRAFWISLPAAALIALLTGSPAVRWVAVGWLLLPGLLLSLANWAILIVHLRNRGKGSSPSFVPPIGLILVVIALLLAPAPGARRFTVFAGIVDPLPLLMLAGLFGRIVRPKPEEPPGPPPPEV